MTKRIESVPVRIGQVWRDNDKRCGERTVEILSVDERWAYCRSTSKRPRRKTTTVRPVRISLERFRPTATGYTLIHDAK